MKLPPELVLMAYELLPVDTNDQVNIKYQVLVEMDCYDYYYKCAARTSTECENPANRWFKNRICFLNPDIHIDYQVCALGRLEEFKYLWKEGYVNYENGSYVPLAARNGHLNILIWLREQKARFDLLITAPICANGHLAVLKWLHDNGYGGWSRNDMNRAAENGHLDVVMWLYHNRNEADIDYVVRLATSQGHTQLVIWLLENVPEDHSVSAMNYAVVCLNLDLLKWLHANRFAVFTNEFHSLLENGIRSEAYLQSLLDRIKTDL